MKKRCVNCHILKHCESRIKVIATYHLFTWRSNLYLLLGNAPPGVVKSPLYVCVLEIHMKCACQ